MLLFRWAMMLLLIAAGCPSRFTPSAPGRCGSKRFGLLVLKWTILAALGFFGVLILERLA
ncbi:MAG: hypothetical protein IPK05_18590 [Comamonadaceae bacterium]|nr:hypothetical protein [Comamonadaceae bacterium]